MAPRVTHDPAVGGRIRTRRLLRGWSIRCAASRAGVSHATWSRIERGIQGTENRFVLADIAAALECPATDLARDPVPVTDQAVSIAQANVYAMRQALMDIDLAGPALRPEQPLPQLSRTVALVEALRQDCDYAGSTRLLPNVLRDLHAATTGPANRAALRQLCLAACQSSGVLRSLGHPAEAWLAAERGRDAAETLDEPVLLGYAARASASAAMACGSLQRAIALACRAIDDLHQHLGMPGTPEMLGSLQLICASASRRMGHLDDSRAWANEATNLSQRTGNTTTLGMQFGPTNVKIWRIAIETDGDDPEHAIEIARTTNPTASTRCRQVFFYADTARAYSRLPGREAEAIRYLLTAERIAPQHIHSSPTVHETARALLAQSYRQADGTQLRGLCERLHLA